MPRRNNPCGKLTTPEQAYEVWGSPDQQVVYYVLRKYELPEMEERNPFAKWYVAAKSPVLDGKLEYGDMFIERVKSNMQMIDNPLCNYVCILLDDTTTFTLADLQKYRFTQMRGKHPMLVNYFRVAVPKRKLEDFKRIAQEHTFPIVCVDAQYETQFCLNHFETERIRAAEEGRRHYPDSAQQEES